MGDLGYVRSWLSEDRFDKVWKRYLFTKDPYDNFLKVLDQYICFWLRYVMFRVSGQLEYSRQDGMRERESETLVKAEIYAKQRK